MCAPAFCYEVSAGEHERIYNQKRENKRNKKSE